MPCPPPGGPSRVGTHPLSTPAPDSRTGLFGSGLLLCGARFEGRVGPADPDGSHRDAETASSAAPSRVPGQDSGSDIVGDDGTAAGAPARAPTGASVSGASPAPDPAGLPSGPPPAHAGTRTRSGDDRGAGVLLAWGVHLFTASGAVVAVAALLALAEGAATRAGLFMMLALAIDSADGTLARAARVSERVPSIDGRRLDDIVDYLNYVIVPAVFLAVEGCLPHPWLVALPVLASAYGFSQREAKTPDDFFLGFPSYWNVVALYAWLLEVPPGITAAVVLLLSMLVFVPLKYLYPSRMRRLFRTTVALGILWAASMTAALLRPDAAARLHLVEISLVFPAWYVAGSLWLGGLCVRRRG